MGIQKNHSIAQKGMALRPLRFGAAPSRFSIIFQAETFQAPGDPRIHGQSGPIKISYTLDLNNVGIQFLEAAMGYEKDRHYIHDANNFHDCNAYGVSL